MYRYRYAFSGKAVDAHPTPGGSGWVVYVDGRTHVFTNEEFQRDFEAQDLEAPRSGIAPRAVALIYICAPFTAENTWEIERNIRRAEEMAFTVTLLGAALGTAAWPVCPHTNTRFFHGAVPEKLAYAGCLEMMRVCAAVYAHPEWSSSEGCCTEVDDADKRGIPTLFNQESLRVWIQEDWPKLAAARQRLERVAAPPPPPPPPPASAPACSDCGIAQLQKYILKDFPSEPGRGSLLEGVGPAPNKSESAVDTAIRLLQCLRAIVNTAGVRV